MADCSTIIVPDSFMSTLHGIRQARPECRGIPLIVLTIFALNRLGWAILFLSTRLTMHTPDCSAWQTVRLSLYRTHSCPLYMEYARPDQNAEESRWSNGTTTESVSPPHSGEMVSTLPRKATRLPSSCTHQAAPASRSPSSSQTCNVWPTFERALLCERFVLHLCSTHMA